MNDFVRYQRDSMNFTQESDAVRVIRPMPNRNNDHTGFTWQPTKKPTVYPKHHRGNHLQFSSRL